MNKKERIQIKIILPGFPVLIGECKISTLLYLYITFGLFEVKRGVLLGQVRPIVL